MGTQEPIYGPDAIQPVTKHDVPYTETKKEDLKWTVQDGTNVETQTFYLFANTGVICIVQALYSNVA